MKITASTIKCCNTLKCEITEAILNWVVYLSQACKSLELHRQFLHIKDSKREEVPRLIYPNSVGLLSFFFSRSVTSRKFLHWSWGTKPDPRIIHDLKKMEMTLNRYSEEKLTKPAGFMPNPTLEEKVSDWNFEKLRQFNFWALPQPFQS